MSVVVGVITGVIAFLSFIGGVWVGTKAGPTATKDIAIAKADLTNATTVVKADVAKVETAAAKVEAVVAPAKPTPAPQAVVAPAPAVVPPVA